MAETIVAKRQLGNGRWDRVLKRRMVELSVADNYDDAKEEWIATGEVWWGQNDNVPEWVENSQMGVGKCLCGHPVVYHFNKCCFSCGWNSTNSYTLHNCLLKFPVSKN